MHTHEVYLSECVCYHLYMLFFAVIPVLPSFSDFLVLYCWYAHESGYIAIGENPHNVENVRVSRPNNRMQLARTENILGSQSEGTPANLFKWSL